MGELPETYTYKSIEVGIEQYTVYKDSKPYFDVINVRGPKPIAEFMQRLCERLDAGRMVENSPSPSQAEREAAADALVRHYGGLGDEEWTGRFPKAVENAIALLRSRPDAPVGVPREKVEALLGDVKDTPKLLREFKWVAQDLENLLALPTDPQEPA